jgi:hypothetical protein
MNTNSINSNGCSVCEQGKENYTTFCPAHRPKQTFYQYDYRHTDGELFTTVAPTLEECRSRRDEWLNKKILTQKIDDWWLMRSFDDLEDITGIEQDRDANNDADALFIDACNQFWQSITFEEKSNIYHSKYKQGDMNNLMNHDNKLNKILIIRYV